MMAATDETGLSAAVERLQIGPPRDQRAFNNWKSKNVKTKAFKAPKTTTGASEPAKTEKTSGYEKGSFAAKAASNSQNKAGQGTAVVIPDSGTETNRNLPKGPKTRPKTKPQVSKKDKPQGGKTKHQAPAPLPSQQGVVQGSPVASAAAADRGTEPVLPTRRGGGPRHGKTTPGRARARSVTTGPASRADMTLPAQVVTNKAPPVFTYVVEAAGHSEDGGIERVVGVYATKGAAEEKAKIILQLCGVDEADIVDVVSSIGSPRSAAVRRSWPNGVSEVRVFVSMLKWIKVLPKELGGKESGEDWAQRVFLALDASGGLFVIGAYRGSEEAREACEKYWMSLSYSSGVQDMDQWLDEAGLFHARGRIGERTHHWYVQAYVVQGKV